MLARSCRWDVLCVVMPVIVGIQVKPVEEAEEAEEADAVETMQVISARALARGGLPEGKKKGATSGVRYANG